MTRREDNSLLDAALAHACYCEAASSALDDVVAALAFALFCLGLYVALSLQVVPV